MALTQCSNQHYYDNDKYNSCPYCKPDEDDEKTVCLQNGSDENSLEQEQNNKNVTDNYISEQSSVNIQYKEDTDLKSRVVVGWLVGLNGNDKGKDFTIYAGMNQMSEVQCSIIYEGIANLCYLFPGSCKTSINGICIEEPKKLKSGDRIMVGENRYDYVAYCHDDIKW